MLPRPSQECLPTSYVRVHFTEHQYGHFLIVVHQQPCQVGRAGIIICRTIWFVSFRKTACTQCNHTGSGCREGGVDTGRPNEPGWTLRLSQTQPASREWRKLCLSSSSKSPFRLKYPQLKEPKGPSLSSPCSFLSYESAISPGLDFHPTGALVWKLVSFLEANTAGQTHFPWVF